MKGISGAPNLRQTALRSRCCLILNHAYVAIKLRVMCRSLEAAWILIELQPA